MQKLHQQKCVPCEGGVPPLKGEILSKYMKQVTGWRLLEKKKISKEYKFKDDKKAFAFLKKIAEISIQHGHHPAATWTYDTVSIEFWTHAINGLSTNDFIMASKFDKIFRKK